MIRAGKLNRRVTLWRLPPDTLVPVKQAEAWASIRSRADENLSPAPQGFRYQADGGPGPPPSGLRHPIPLEIRMRWRAELQPNDYIRWGDRLFHCYGIRDPDGKNTETIVSAHELIGTPAVYQATPLSSPIATRAFIRFDAPYVGAEARAVDYRAQLELPIFEVQRPARGAKVTLGTVVWTVQTLIADDNIVRAVWATQ
jgi:hypothetical protein